MLISSFKARDTWNDSRFIFSCFANVRHQIHALSIITLTRNDSVRVSANVFEIK